MELLESSPPPELGGKVIVEKTEMVSEGEESESALKNRWNWKMRLGLGLEVEDLREHTEFSA